MFNKLKQFRDLRNQAKQLQNTLKEEKIEIEKGGVSLTMDGSQEVMFYKITDSELLSPQKKEELERRLKDATNAALEKTKKVMAQKMQSMGGLDAFGMGKK